MLKSIEYTSGGIKELIKKCPLAVKTYNTGRSLFDLLQLSCVGKRETEYLNNVFSSPPIVIGGCARSGTTMLLAILGAHPGVFSIPYETNAFCLGESNYLPKIFTKKMYRRSITRALYDCKEQIFDKPSASIRCEKTPRNIHEFDQIQDIYSDARFIQIVRDGRDVVTSHHPGSSKKYHVEPKRWIHDVSAGLKYVENPTLYPNVYTTKYEDVILNPKETIAGILDFLGLNTDEFPEDRHNHTCVKSSNAWHNGGAVQPLFETSLKKREKPEHAEIVKKFYGDPQTRKILDIHGYQ